MNQLQLLKVLCVSELPRQIKNCIILPPPAQIIAYLYRITHIASGRIYIGMHTWDGIEYWFSQKENKELSKLWGKEIKGFDYEVFDYGTTEEMKTKEALLLESLNAKNDSKYFNESNSMRVKSKDLEKDSLLAKQLIKQIKENKWPAIKVTKEMIEDLEFKQCREEALNRDKLLEITDRIQAKGGSTEVCQPLIILQDRNGNDLGVNGFHTFNAFMGASNATEIDAIFVPKEYHKNIPDSLLNEIGNTFNKKDTFVSTKVSQKDVLKELLDKHYDGYKITEDYIRQQCILEYNFTSREAGKVVAKFKKQKKIDSKNKQMNQTYLTPSSTIKTKKKNELKKQYPNKTILIQSSTTFTLDRAYKACRKQNSRDVLIVVHHPDSVDEQIWNNSRCQEFIDLQDYSNSDIKIQYESLSGWSIDILSK
jgi:hypothetical protein